MRRFYAVVAVLALVGCDRTATAAEGNAAHADLVPSEPQPVLTVAPTLAVVSVRRWAPGFYVARGLSITDEDVHLIVRRNSLALGFQGLTAGTLVQDEYLPNGDEMSFSTAAGYRYLVIAVPSPGGVDDLEHATFTEFVP